MFTLNFLQLPYVSAKRNLFFFWPGLPVCWLLHAVFMTHSIFHWKKFNFSLSSLFFWSFLKGVNLNYIPNDGCIVMIIECERTCVSCNDQTFSWQPIDLSDSSSNTWTPLMASNCIARMVCIATDNCCVRRLRTWVEFSLGLMNERKIWVMSSLRIIPKVLKKSA